MPDEPKIHAERITIYDSVHIPSGEKVPERITFSFGADAQNPNEEHLVELKESEIIEQVLAAPVLLQRLLAFLEVEYPNCWIVTEVLTKDMSKSWPHSKPGDLDLVCGNMRDGRPDFNFIATAQIKIRKVRTFADSGDFASGSGTTQAHSTARMGFDRTLLLHCIVREPQPTPEGYAASWNPIVNADFERAATGCFGTIRKRLEDDRELYGFAWLGWGQAFGKAWKTCGGFALDLVYPPPHRPTDSDEARHTRTEMAEAVRQLLARSENRSLPFVVQCKGKPL